MTDLLVVTNGRFQRGRAGKRWDKVTTRLRQIFGNGVEIYFTAEREQTKRTQQRGSLSAGDSHRNPQINATFPPNSFLNRGFR